MEIIWIRHGMTKGNEEKRYIGQTEEALSARGILELQEKKEQGFYPQAEIVIASPMKRCIQTAELLYPGKPIRTIDRLREMDFGCWEGRTYQEILADPLLMEGYQAFLDSNGESPAPGGESKAEFMERTLAAFDEVFRGLESRRTACIVHGGTIMSILSERLDGPKKAYYDFQVPNGDGYTAQYSDGRLHDAKRLSMEWQKRKDTEYR